MFYSHEILTSPKHGVATVWLAATLGPKSATRKINRKAILDVNVPGACRVIIDPEAPMALRLQGSLLYGVTRVYNQQCGYTLLEAQSMHDKMVSMLKLLPGGGIDPSAGRARPSTLILPYDPSFLPETGLPGLDLDLSLFKRLTNLDSTQHFGLWSEPTAGSHSSLSQTGNIHLELPQDDGLVGAGLQRPDDGVYGSAAKRGLFGRAPLVPLDRQNEEGILLQPDFEFDEHGNIVEFDVSRLSPRKRRRISSMPQLEETPGSIQLQNERLTDVKAMQLDQGEILIQDEDTMNLDIAHGNATSQTKHRTETGVPDPTEIRRARSSNRPAREIVPDEKTSLRNTDLANWNQNYLANMAQANKQKQHNKLPTIAKKNAAFWVYGQGLGSVGKGLGAQPEPHPLAMFSGIKLFQSIGGEIITEEREEAENETTRSRARETEQPRDVEFARQAPSSIIDEHSSQMPWNISSIHSGQRYGSVESRIESSSRIGGRRGRLTSASPLVLKSRRRQAGDIPADQDPTMTLDEELDITRYLEDELAYDRGEVSSLSRGRSVDLERVTAGLDADTLNFFEFIQEVLTEEEIPGITFEELLPPEETKQVVAVQAFVNVLTLANKGALRVRQAPSSDGGFSAWPRWQFGDISMRVAGD
ncbi:hypothetical protein N7532_002693 [Penicillium argentinense]|uniref:Rad21/Rec8-like protein N-terminal domain-containing protein n=1 Tax=Penicillium argentinense TaxID=1131581 RepID=A0A9W9G0X1_9EURO|nr:uncharacterized protein N7532_002693 [Penicillium argentinense]KAJ5110048.1 hypothetical protein N7532_002693 [Penicillium argentinense]